MQLLCSYSSLRGCPAQVCRPGLRSFKRGAFWFLLEYLSFFSFPCHATCMCTTGNSPHSVIFTAKLVFNHEQSVRLLVCWFQKPQRLPAQDSSDFSQMSAKAFKSLQKQENKQTSMLRQKGTKAKLLWESQSSGQRGSGAVKGVRISSHSTGGKSTPRTTFFSCFR